MKITQTAIFSVEPKRELCPPGRLLGLVRLSIVRFLAVMITAATVFGSVFSTTAAAADRPSKKQQKQQQQQLKSAIADLVKAIQADPAKADELLVAAMKANEKNGLACQLVEPALGALPKKDNAPDAYMLASMVKKSLELIYAQLPECRPAVKGIILAAVNALNNGGIDSRALTIVLNAALPELLANDAGLIDELIAAIAAIAPNSAQLLALLEANLLTPLNSQTVERMALDESVLLPIFEVTPVHAGSQP